MSLNPQKASLPVCQGSEQMIEFQNESHTDELAAASHFIDETVKSCRLRKTLRVRRRIGLKVLFPPVPPPSPSFQRAMLAAWSGE